MKLLRFWANKHHKDTQTHTKTDEKTNWRTERRKDGRREGWREKVKSQKKKRKLVLKSERRERKRAEMEGEMAKRNHAWFTFNLSKGHGLPCGARARVRPLWAEQWVLIVLLVGVVGVVLGHGNWDGGGEELAPLPRILEAAERARLLLIPYIYKQDRHKEKNCREIWTQTERERVKRKKNIKEKKEENLKKMKKTPKNVHFKCDLTQNWVFENIDRIKHGFLKYWSKNWKKLLHYYFSIIWISIF